MKDTYTTSNGLRLIKSFAQDESGRDHLETEYKKNERKAIRAARRLLCSGSLEIVGSDLIGGLVYTSSSCFAGLWNCNTSARKRGTRAYFNGIAISDDGVPVAVYTEHDQNGNGVETICEFISKEA